MRADELVAVILMLAVATLVAAAVAERPPIIDVTVREGSQILARGRIAIPDPTPPARGKAGERPTFAIDIPLDSQPIAVEAIGTEASAAPAGKAEGGSDAGGSGTGLALLFLLVVALAIVAALLRRPPGPTPDRRRRVRIDVRRVGGE